MPDACAAQLAAQLAAMKLAAQLADANFAAVSRSPKLSESQFVVSALGKVKFIIHPIPMRSEALNHCARKSELHRQCFLIVTQELRLH